MTVRDITFNAADGYRLRGTVFLPAQDRVPTSALVINSATGVHRRFYSRLASYLSARYGYAVLTYDFRGIAESRPHNLRSFTARIRDWPLLDMPAATEWLAQEIRPRRLFVLGHSAGGNLIGLMPNLAVVDGVILIAAQLGYWRLWPRSIRYLLAANWYLAIPVLSRIFGYVPAWLGAGQHWPGRIARELARWCRHPEYLFGDPSLDRTGYERYAGQILSLTFEDDPHATCAANDSLLARFSNASVTRWHVSPHDVGVPKIGHFGFFRPFCEPLWEQCAMWLADDQQPTTSADFLDPPRLGEAHHG